MANHGKPQHDNPAAHVDSPAGLFVLFLVLLAGSTLTIAVSMMGLGEKQLLVHMAISTVQACIVGYYFMHLKRSDSLTWLTAFSAFFIMAILFALPLGDFLTRKWGAL
jgi:caa(3)-type oxidase subunit IV